MLRHFALGGSVSNRPLSAVVFDLYDTLVPGGERTVRDSVSHAMAADLDVDPVALAQEIRASFDDRARGLLGDLTATITTLARRLGGDPSRAAVRAAAGRRMALHRSLLRPSTATLNVLDELRGDGYRLGLVSDCSAETPMLWAQTSLAGRIDAAVFSCVSGVRKPSAVVYENAADALGVDTTACTYVGDGASDELNGATAAGMTALQLHVTRVNQDDTADHGIVYGARPWHGPVIHDLAQLPALLADRSGTR
jgi:putative hydrolase of the HAD superfamily